MIGKHIGIGDKLIIKTDKASKNTRITRKLQKESPTAAEKVKMTFYIEKGLLKMLYNYAFWERTTLTDAFNIAVTDGLKGKNTAGRLKNEP